MKSNPEPKVVVQWQPTTGEPSPAFKKLWSKLLANRKRQPISAGQPTADGQAEKQENTKTGGVDEGRVEPTSFV